METQLSGIILNFKLLHWLTWKSVWFLIEIIMSVACHVVSAPGHRSRGSVFKSSSRLGRRNVCLYAQTRWETWTSVEGTGGTEKVFFLINSFYLFIHLLFVCCCCIIIIDYVCYFFIIYYVCYCCIFQVHGEAVAKGCPYCYRCWKKRSICCCGGRQIA